MSTKPAICRKTRQHCLVGLLVSKWGEKTLCSVWIYKIVRISIRPPFLALPSLAGALFWNKCWSNKLLFAVSHLADNKTFCVADNEEAVGVAARGSCDITGKAY